jgi:hypothetical protein
MAHDAEIEVLVELINEWGDVPRERAGNQFSPYPPLNHFVTRHAGFWRGIPGVQLQQLVDVANRVFPVFAAESGGELARLLRELVADAGLTASWEAEGWTVRQAWVTDIHQPAGHPEQQPELTLLAAAVRTLIEHMCECPDGSRLGTCSADACADVYVDHSSDGHRHYCSLTCQNRQRARVYRAGRRAEAVRGLTIVEEAPK